jgi:anti-sigma B factor antagonist
MKLEIEGDTLRIFGPAELTAPHSSAFRDQARAAFKPALKQIDIDLSDTAFIDSSGLGALVALHKTACHRTGAVRLLRPQPSVRQMLELTRMHRLFEIVKE